MIRLVEFFSLDETDDDDEEKFRKQMAMRQAFDPPARGTVKTSTGQQGDTSILQQKPQKKAGATTKKMDPTSMPGYVPKAGMGTPTTKPQYKGNFHGQTAKAGQHFGSKKVSWQDKPPPEGSGDRKYGRVLSKVPHEWVWDANAQDWITPGAWKLKYVDKDANYEEKLQRESLIRRFLTEAGLDDFFRQSDREMGKGGPWVDSYAGKPYDDPERIKKIGGTSKKQKYSDLVKSLAGVLADEVEGFVKYGTNFKAVVVAFQDLWEELGGPRNAPQEIVDLKQAVSADVNGNNKKEILRRVDNLRRHFGVV